MKHTIQTKSVTINNSNDEPVSDIAGRSLAEPVVETCKKCAVPFGCTANGVPGSCWCSAFPVVMPLSHSDDRCYCPACLSEVMAERIEQAIDELPRKDILSLAARYKNDKKLIEHIDYTLENGLTVFTRWFHLKRGYCCGNACRNCPFNHEAVKS